MTTPKIPTVHKGDSGFTSGTAVSIPVLPVSSGCSLSLPSSIGLRRKSLRLQSNAALSQNATSTG